MGNSYQNRVLRINLTEAKISEESLSTDLIHDYIGGRGFGVKMLYDELMPNTNPLGEESKLIFLVGPLAGTHAQSLGRWKVFFKSPLTGGYFKSSGGGHFGAELKAANFDAIIIEGHSERKVYLWIHDGKYELRDARYLEGLDCDDTHVLIREELHDPRIRIACIGPAGENGVSYAGIFSDRRAAARGGGGTVMGSKNLKAIAVRGNGKVIAANPTAFTAALQMQTSRIRNSSGYKHFSEHGTQATVELIHNVLGIFPVKNFREGVMPDIRNLSGDSFDKVRVGKRACSGCMVRCASITKINEGKYRGAWSEGPEYETIWGFSGPFAAADIGLTVAADKLCDDLGIDTMSASGTIGFAYELYERGLITSQDTDGLELIYGNLDPILPLLNMIADRQGIGDILARGTREAARLIGKGSEDYAMQVKGLEMPGYDPRGAKAHGLNYITIGIGADHNSGYAVEEIFGKRYKGEKIDRFAVKDKGEICKHNQDLTAIFETGTMCTFANPYHNDLSYYGNLLSAATGIDDFSDPDYLWQVGERILNLERMFNLREGFNRNDDTLPTRFMTQTLNDGPAAGQIFEQEELLDDYYRVRDWDVETGIPNESKLNELGLGFTLPH